MFFSDMKQQNNDKNWRNKEQQFHKQSTKKDRQNRLQNQRYFHFMEVIDWRMNIHNFRNKVQNVCNYYTLLNTLFAISQEVNWRQYIQHMILLVSKFHKMMFDKQGASTKDITKFDNFQSRFQKLFLLKDLNLHKHLILLLKMLLSLNGKYAFMKETTFAEILAQSAIYNDVETVSDVLWTLTQIEISNSALVKLIKQESLSYTIQKSDNCLLPLLTIIANFISNPNENSQVVEQLITSTVFQKAFQLGLLNNKIEIVNETILIFNNGICFSSSVRKILLKQQKILSMIMNVQCAEKQKSLQILRLLGLSSKSIKNGI